LKVFNLKGKLGIFPIIFFELRKLLLKRSTQKATRLMGAHMPLEEDYRKNGQKRQCARAMRIASAHAAIARYYLNKEAAPINFFQISIIFVNG